MSRLLGCVAHKLGLNLRDGTSLGVSQNAVHC